MKRLCWLVLSILVSTPALALPDRPEVIKRGDYETLRAYGAELIEAWRDDEDIEAISVVVVDNQQIVWAAGFGMADVERKIPATVQTGYGAGALSSLFTVVAVMQLVEQGKVELDAPVSRYLPDFKIRSRYPATANCTVRQLLTHHAGLPANLLKGMWGKNPETLEALMRQLPAESAAFAPGYVFAQSNLGYSVLGRMVEKISGVPFAKYMDERVLSPLGMKQSSFVMERLALAKGYKKGKVKNHLWPRDTPALGLATTAIDLGRFLQASFNSGSFAGKSVWSENSGREWVRVQNADVALDLDRDIGLGWQLSGVDLAGGGMVASRVGATLLHRSRIAMLPQHKLGIAILSNSTNSFRAQESIENELLALALEIKTGISQPKEGPTSTPLPAPVAAFAPVYATNIGLISVRPDGANYRANVMGWDLKLTPRKDQWYTIEYSFFGFIPIKLDWIADVAVAPVQVAGRSAVSLLYKNQRSLFGIDYAPREPDKAWLARVGRYEAVARDELLDQMEVTSGELKIEGRQLVFAYRLPWKLPLTLSVPIQPLDAETAIIPGLGTGLNETVRVVKTGDQERLRYSGYELERVSEPDGLAQSY